ncbi:methionine synthase [Nocardia stercoris]|uniref:Methionine synthase n=1 Tax=Nocardia stercoris TaxID=2483361 RepID=A0A3M2LD38_9NOCA|nr:methionine synthase [Nocardia stercoris]RMI35439.1 methionine synthase [Nocardia stercoris]
MSDAATESTALPGGIATGVGSWPGTDPREAAATMVGELPELAHLVELPARGAGSDMIGRASALLVDLRLDTSVRGYRLGPGRGAVSRRAHDLLRTDVDALEEAWETAGLLGSGRTVKVQSVGPLTLAAQVELMNGHRVLTDTGAVRDLTESLAEGVANHAAEVARRLGATVVVQFDEPSLTDVLTGSLTGASVLNIVRALPEPEAQALLDTVLTAQTGPTLLHTCAGRPALNFLRGTAATVIGFDLGRIGTADLDSVGELLDAGKHVALGLIPTTAPAVPPSWRELAEPGVRLLDRLGMPRRLLAERVLVTPTCGLAGATPAWARRALTLAREIAHAYSDEPEALALRDKVSRPRTVGYDPR